MRRCFTPVVCLLLLAFTGCKSGSTSGPSQTTRTVSVTRSGNGTGTVTSTPAGISCGSSCTSSFQTTTAVTLTAAAGANSSFAGWSVACSGTSATCTIPAGTSSATANAQFDRLPATITVALAGNGSGTVTSAPAGINCGTTCAAEFGFGTVVTLTAAPNASSTFTGWSGGGCSGTGTCVITVDLATTVTATFAIAQRTLTVTLAGTGSGIVTANPAGITCGSGGSDCTEPYAHGTVVTLTAVAPASADFTGWSGGGCSGTGTCVVTMNAATTVTATFTLVQFQLSVTRAGAGTGTVTSAPAGISCGTDCSESYNRGTGVTLTAAAANGSTFTGWTGAGCTGTGTCVVVMNAASAVTATFAVQQYTLTVVKAGSGAGAVSSNPAGVACDADCSEPYDHGTVVTLTASTDDASVFAGWSGAGCTGIGTCVVTMNAAATVTATFNTFQQAWPDEHTRTCTDGAVTLACPGGPAGQDGHYLINVPTYFVMGGRVRDQVSGLTWERNPSYTPIAHAAALAYCDGLVLDGFSDWRLPDFLEMVSLVDAGRTVPGFTTSAFPGIPQNTVFWMSTMKAGSATLAYQMGSNYPVTSFGTITDPGSHLVRCVRGAGFAGAFAAGAGTVTDGRTGLVWESGTAPGTMNWADALARCEALVLDGQSDWRLPNAKELLSLVDPTLASPTISPLFASRPATTFWTSTPLSTQGTHAYMVSFSIGGNPDISSPMTTLYSVRCVR